MPVAKVQLPDGRIGRFEVPEGTTPEQVIEFAKNMTPPAAEPPPAPDTGPKPPMTLDERAKDVFGFKDYAERGTILPFGKTASGEVEFATPQIGVDLAKTFLLPGHAAQGGSYTPMDTLTMAAQISPVSAATRAGEKAIPGVSTTHKPVPQKVPTAAELRAAANAGYKRADDLGVTYPATAVKGLADDISNSLNAEGRIAELNPELFALLRKLQEPPEGSFATLQAIDAFRKRLGDIAGSGDRAKSAAATIAIKRLDDFINAGGQAGPVAGASTSARLPGSVAPNLADEAANTIKAARGNAAAAFRSDDLTGINDIAELRAAAAGSGRNLGNTIRQRLASFLADESNTRGFSEQEIAAIRQVVEGTASTNTLRQVSNMLGGGGGIGQSAIAALGATAGGSIAGPYGVAAGAALPAAMGAGTRSLYNRLAGRQLRSVDEMVRARSPLNASRIANAPRDVSVPEVRAALSRLMLSELLAGETQTQDGRLGRMLRP